MEMGLLLEPFGPEENIPGMMELRDSSERG